MYERTMYESIIFPNAQLRRWQRQKRHGKFRYRVNRNHKDIENLARVQKILAKESNVNNR